MIMEKIGLFFGSNGGVTEDSAKAIKSALEAKGATVELKNVSTATKDDLGQYKNIVFGTSTWGMGDLQDDWEDFVEVVASADFSGKTVAIFGTGDQYGYPDTFVDGIGMIYEAISEATIIGKWSVDGYEFDDSKGLVDGEFVGLVLDEDNQSDMSDERISKWVEGLVKALA
jgi:flavodoxin I